MGPLDDQYKSVNLTIANGKYRWEGAGIKPQPSGTPGPGPFISANLTKHVDINTYLATTARRISGPSSSYGLIFRLGKDGYYYFVVADNAQGFAVFLYFSAGGVDTIINWQNTPVIKANGENRLAVEARGSHFTFYINDKPVDTADDNRLPDGTKAGIMIEMPPTGEKATFEFDDFEARSLLPAATSTTGATAELSTTILPNTPLPTDIVVIPYSEQPVNVDGDCQPTEYEHALLKNLLDQHHVEQGSVRLQHNKSYIYVCLEGKVTTDASLQRYFTVQFASNDVPNCEPWDSSSPCKQINFFLDNRPQSLLEHGLARYKNHDNTDMAEFAISIADIIKEPFCDNGKAIFMTGMNMDVARYWVYQPNTWYDLTGSSTDAYAQPKKWVPFALACKP